jgi:hypothetical protein
MSPAALQANAPLRGGWSSPGGNGGGAAAALKGKCKLNAESVRHSPVSDRHGCEHVFVTTQGSFYGRFRRALDGGNATEALAAARELRYVGLLEALELCLLLRDKAPEKYSRAAVRWHSRFVRELPGVSIEHSQAVLAALGAIGSDESKSAARALAELLKGRGFERAGDVLISWSDAARNHSRGAGP